MYLKDTTNRPEEEWGKEAGMARRESNEKRGEETSKTDAK